MISRFTHAINVCEDMVAVYNSLVNDVIYMTNEEWETIKLKDINNTHIINNELFEAGILVKNPEIDSEALENLKNIYNTFSGKISILYLIVSSSCNLKCRYCFIDESEKTDCTKDKIMDKRVALCATQKFIEYIKNYSITNPQIIFYGGEPFLGWDCIKECVEYVKNNSIKIDFSIVTNGTLIDQEKAKFIAENNINIGISVDGPKEINDKNRLFKNNNSSVYDYINKKFDILDENNCPWGTSITISQDLIEHKDEFFFWLQNSNNIKGVFYNLLHFTHKNSEWENYYKQASEFLIESYEKLADKGTPDGRLMRKIDSFINKEFKFTDCGASGLNQLTIRPNGTVCICHGEHKNYDIDLGNIMTDNIIDILGKIESKLWLRCAPLFKDECLKCEALFICGGGCPVQAETLFGGKDEIDRCSCIHSKESLLWLLKKGVECTE